MADEKAPFQSKKFLAYMWADTTLKLMFLAVLLWAWKLDEIAFRPFILLLTIVVVAGFIAVGYILGVAQLDKYTRLAQIMVQAGSQANGSAAKLLSKGTRGLVELAPTKDAGGEVELVPAEEPEDEDDLSEPYK